MATGSGRYVKKTVNFDIQLAGAIGAWADASGKDFGSAVRELCAMGLATWPGNAFSPAPAAGAVGTITGEIARAKEEILAAMQECVDNAVDELVTAGW